MKKSIIRVALAIARRKLDIHPEIAHFPHYSFVVQHNRIVEWATNARQEPPKHYGYHRSDDADYKPKLHSEIRAYRRARGVMDLGDYFEIINVRLTRAGMVRMSRPCVACYGLLGELGCARFFYSTNCGLFEHCALDQLAA